VDYGIRFPSPKAPSTPSSFGVTTPVEADAALYQQGLAGKLEGHSLEFAVEALLGTYDHHRNSFHAAKDAIKEFDKQLPLQKQIGRLSHTQVRRWAVRFFADPEGMRRHVRQRAASRNQRLINEHVLAHQQESFTEHQDAAGMAFSR
jgi:hypothetical protein